MATAVIYARFSCSKQREASIDDQIRVCMEYCEREDISVIRTYCDYAMSGKTDDRPQFQEMVANAGESDLVVVYMMDRFSRDPYDAPIYKKQLSKRNVRVVSALEYVDQSPDGIIMEKLLEGLAARESMVTSIRTKRGMEGNAKKALYNGYRVYGYGVDENNRYIINEFEASYVREAYKRRVTRESVNSIAQDFAVRGVKTRQGNPCSYMMVYTMLKNERYTGVYIWDDVRIEGGMPAIISKEEFDAVQGVVGKKQRKNEVFADYPLSGKAVCGYCGRNMIGHSAHNKANVRYDYYRCGKDCGAKMVRREVIEGRIVEELRKLMMGDEAYIVAEQIEKAWNRSKMSLAKEEAAQRLRKAQDGKKKLIQAVEDGMPFAAVKDRFDELGEIEKRAQKDYDSHKNDGVFDSEKFITFLRQGALLDGKRLLNAFVSQAVVFQDRIFVTLNYNEKMRTIRGS